MKRAATMTSIALMMLAGGCTSAYTPKPGEDVNGDGEVTFYDLEHRQKPTVTYDPPVDFQWQFDIQMDRQSPDYRQRVREGKASEY